MNRKTEILEEMERLANEFVEIVETEHSNDETVKSYDGNLMLLMTDGKHALQRVYASALDIAVYMEENESTNKVIKEATEVKNITEMNDNEENEEE